MQPSDIGEQIQYMRLTLKLSQTELARRFGVSHNCISMIETGRKSNVTIGILSKIFFALGYKTEFTLKNCQEDVHLTSGSS